MPEQTLTLYHVLHGSLCLDGYITGARVKTTLLEFYVLVQCYNKNKKSPRVLRIGNTSPVYVNYSKLTDPKHSNAQLYRIFSVNSYLVNPNASVYIYPTFSDFLNELKAVSIMKLL